MPRLRVHGRREVETEDTVNPCQKCFEHKPNKEFPFIRQSGLYSRECKACRSVRQKKNRALWNTLNNAIKSKEEGKRVPPPLVDKSEFEAIAKRLGYKIEGLSILEDAASDEDEAKL